MSNIPDVTVYATCDVCSEKSPVHEGTNVPYLHARVRSWTEGHARDWMVNLGHKHISFTVTEKRYQDLQLREVTA